MENIVNSQVLQIRATLVKNGYTLIEGDHVYRKTRVTGAKTIIDIASTRMYVNVRRSIFTAKEFLVSQVTLSTATQSEDEVISLLI